MLMTAVQNSQISNTRQWLSFIIIASINKKTEIVSSQYIIYHLVKASVKKRSHTPAVIYTLYSLNK